MEESQLLDENRKLRKALLQIVFETSKEGMEKQKQKSIQEGHYYHRSEYPAAVGCANAIAMYGLYGDTYLYGDADEHEAKAREELAEYDK